MIFALLAFTAYVFFERCFVHVNCRDEVVYEFVWEQDDPVYLWDTGHRFERRVESLTDIMQTQLLHYQRVNGRAWIHTVEQAFTGHMLLFSVVNTLVFLGMAWLIVRIVTGRWLCGNYAVWLATLLALLYLFPAAASLWTSVNMGLNYLWPAALSLVGLLVWQRLSAREFVPKWCYPLISLLGLAIGWSHEAIGAPFAGAMVLVFLLRWNHVPRRVLWLSVPVCLGATLLVFAPGNFFRLGYSQVGFEYLFVKVFRRDTVSFILSNVAVVAVSAFFMYYKWKPCKRFTASNYQLVTVYLICMTFTLLVFSNTHAWTFALIYLYTVLLRAMYLRGRFADTRVLRVAAAVLTVLFVAHGCLVVSDNRRNYDMQQGVVQQIRQAEAGDTIIVPEAPVSELSKPYTVRWKLPSYHVQSQMIATGRPNLELVFIQPERCDTMRVPLQQSH